MSTATPPAVAGTVHDLRVRPEEFRSVDTGGRSVELRWDAGYNVGDVLLLREWSCRGVYTGRECRRVVTHIVRGTDGIAPGWVALSIGVAAERAR
ncbi:DUF3850 domain-containing protein [Aldersonia sp. NBC_00410]|uniref:DUF3850 domain-containing protein n=1 Tax=Aldersonia sp. NBC_00410 TaxID=2975954 RepID=UPI002255A5CD|nr:DUF3850 domain-containing protein [Aldersonia sp. NBC_00410]MCX5046692.1 DUF3850 domain-containing protein [Aldersonia sp. NBC_00410]